MCRIIRNQQGITGGDGILAGIQGAVGQQDDGMITGGGGVGIGCVQVVELLIANAEQSRIIRKKHGVDRCVTGGFQVVGGTTGQDIAVAILPAGEDVAGAGGGHQGVGGADRINIRAGSRDSRSVGFRDGVGAAALGVGEGHGHFGQGEPGDGSRIVALICISISGILGILNLCLSVIPAHELVARCGSCHQGVSGAAGIGLGSTCSHVLTVYSIGTVLSRAKGNCALGNKVRHRNFRILNA